MLRKLVREPLVHFLVLALAIFGLYSALDGPQAAKTGDIVVTQAKIEQIAGIFQRTWQRQPTLDELKGLIDDHVREEVYYREALALGLDKDDTVIRRRLRQKIEFLDDDPLEALAPTDAELDGYMRANSAKFAINPAVAFRQIYLSPERRGDSIDKEALAILEALRADPSLDPASLGDATLLPYEMGLSSPVAIGRTFGPEFAEALFKIAPGNWLGPIKSSFGLHIVRVGDATPARLPELAEVRAAVLREWSNAQRKAIADRRFGELLKRYEVTIEALPVGASAASAKP